MQLGMIGLGRMGGNMTAQLRKAGHDVIGYDINREISDVSSLEELIENLEAPRVVWVMLPSGEPTITTVQKLATLLTAGDLVVEGGNSHYLDDAQHAQLLAEKSVSYVDVGVSAGVWGTRDGYALMAGGDAGHIEKLMPIFEALKPKGGSGFIHAGDIGAGHFAKMIHNSIEYGIMQSYAEGYEVLASTGVVRNVSEVFASWQQGTVIRSWLLDLLVRVLDNDPELVKLKGYAEDSGQGRWTVQLAMDHAIPTPVIAASVMARFNSRQDDSPAMKVIAALRNEFGGHSVVENT